MADETNPVPAPVPGAVPAAAASVVIPVGTPEPHLLCRCGALMAGAPHAGTGWNCQKGHRFRVTSAQSPIGAVALRGDRASGVEVDRNYLWRIVAGVSPTKPTPR